MRGRSGRRASQDPTLTAALGVLSWRATISAMTMQIPRGEHVPTADQRVVMYDVSWEAYETMLDVRGERPQPRMAYLDGALELMTTSYDHERIKSWISRLIDAYMLDAGIPFGCYGQWTMKRKPRAAGGE